MAMFYRAVFAIKEKFIGIKSEIISNWQFYIATAGTVLLAIITSISVTVQEDEQSLNYIALVIAGSTNPVGYILGIALAVFILFLAAYFASYHFAFWTCVYPVIFAVSKILFTITFKSILLDGIVGVIMLLTFAFPSTLICIFFITKLLHETFELCGYSTNKIRRINNFCHRKYIFKLDMKYGIYVAIATYIFWFSGYIIAVIAVK